MKIFKLFLATLGVVFAGNVCAQNTITAADVTIEKGGTADVAVSISFTEQAWSAEFNIELPEGFTVESVAKNAEMLPSDKQVVEISGTKVTALPSDFGEDVFATASGVFATITIKAPEEIEDGEYTGTIKNGAIGNLEGDNFDTEDATFKITVGGAEPEPEPYVEPEGTHQIEGGLGNLITPNTYDNIAAWGGTWSGNNIENERDWSKFDYLWIKYKDFSGSINFGIMYSEWVATQSWGEQYYDENVAIKDPSGVIGIKINHEKVYENGNAKEDGAYKGDIYSKHIREIFIQATAGGSAITIEEMWLGSEEDYLAAVEANKYVDPTVYAAITDEQSFFSKEYPNPDLVASTVEDGVIVVNSPAKVSQDWDSQFWIWLNQKLPAGAKFKVSFEYKASAAANGVATQCHNNPGDYVHYICIGNLNFTTEWQKVDDTFTVPNECDGSEHMDGGNPTGWLNEFHSIAFNLTKSEDITYYFKNIVVEIDQNDVAEEAEHFTPIPTGIKTFTTTQKENVLYNLAGQRVDKNYKGIVIDNGKKRMNK
jgi:hypothetical protein